MRKTMLTFAILALFAATALPRCFVSASELLHQMVVVGGVAATVSIKPYPFVRNDFIIQAEFKSPTYPVGCLSAYDDLRYELRASDGHIIPVSQQALKHPPQEDHIIMHPVIGGPPRDCALNTNNGVWRVQSEFSTLYPNVPRGKYALQIIFAPHGAAQQATFAPVPISIEP